MNYSRRVKADFDNYRKRMSAEKANTRSYALSDFMCRLLPVIDNMDRALEAAGKEGVPASYLQGMEMIRKQVMEVMEKEGVTCIDAEGKCFDPNYHQAVMRTDEGDGEPDTVVEEFQKGYMLKKRVLRPSMVKVFTG